MSLDHVQGFHGHFRRWAFATVGEVKRPFLDYLAATVGVIALTLGTMALVVGRVESGVTLPQDGDRIVIDWVASQSPAASHGLESGMVLLNLNGRELIRLP